MDWDTETKGIARSVALQPTPLAFRNTRGTARYKSARTALSLPGNRLLCIREGFKTGLYTPNTYHVVVERDPVVQKEISRKLHLLGSQWEPYFHCGELHQLNVPQALLGHSLDWAYLDLCATINSRLGWWFKNALVPSLSPGAGLAVTVVRCWRASKCMAAAVDLIRNTEAGKTLLSKMDSQVRQATLVGNTAYRHLFIEDENRWSRYTGRDGSWWHYGRKPSKFSARLSPIFHDSSLEAMAVLQLLMPHHSFRVDGCVEYQRDPERICHHMTTIRLVDIVPTKASRELLALADTLDDYLIAQKMVSTTFNGQRKHSLAA